MMFIPEEAIDRLLAEDVPYIDLTTWALGIGERRGEIVYFTREDAVLCGTEEALRIMERLHIEADLSLPSGSGIKADEVFLRAYGRAADLHMAWKVCQNIFDHCSGIATKTRQMTRLARAVNPHVTIVATRKGFPGTKALAMKAVMAGGAFPHRLGLSETVLVFPQHMNFMGGLEGFITAAPDIKRHVCEKQLIVEARSVEDGVRLCLAGVDGVQFDKLPAGELAAAVPQLRAVNPHVVLLAAGGITEKNVAEYAQTGVDALVTTNLFSARPIDIGVRINALE